MRKANFWRIAGVLLAAILIIGGCSGGSTTGGNSVPVTGVSVEDENGLKSSILWINVEEGNPNGLPTSVTLTATVAPNNATNKNITWTSGSPSKATVSNAGVVIPVATGTSVITVTTKDGNKTDTYSVEVKDADTYVAVDSVEILHLGQAITELDFDKVGNVFTPATAQLTLQYSPSGADPVTGPFWESDDPAVATVSNTGLVTPKGAGATTITVTVNGDITASIDVTVTEVNLGDYDPVDSVSVTPGEAIVFTKIGEVPFSPASKLLSAVVSPTTAYDGVTWTSDTPTVATVVEGLVTPVAAGTAKIYATSVGEKTGGGTVKSNEVTVTVTVESAPSAALVLYNQSGTGAGTTTDLAAAWNDTTKKYTITNVDGGIAAGESPNSTGGVTKATIVYLNTPITGTTQAISARVRLVNGTTGVLMGLMTDPTGDIRFQGIRATTNAALWRAYHSRTNTNSSTALTVQNNSGYGERTYQNPGSDSNQYASQIDSTDIPVDEEFILEYERTAAANYTVRMKSYSGVLIASLSSTGATFNTGVEYPGFIVAGAEVEISQITIKNGATEVFSTPASTPTPTPVASVEIYDVPGITGNAGDGYECDSLISTALTLKARILPARAPQSISWALTQGSGAFTTATNLLTVGFTTPGTAETVKVTATAGGASAVLTIAVASSAAPLTAITINAAGGATSLRGSGGGNPAQTVQFEWEKSPPTAANPGLTWYVKTTDSNAGANATVATISNTGLLEVAGTLSQATDVWVFAQANSTIWSNMVDVEGSAVSKGVKITVYPYNPFQLISVKVGGSTKASTSYDTVNSELTIKGNGIFDNAGTQTDMHLVYLNVPLSASAFNTQLDTIPSKSSFTSASTSNNSRAGLIVFTRDPALAPVDRTPYSMVYFRSAVLSAANRTQKQAVGAANSGGTSGVGDTPTNAAPHTLGLYKNSGGNAVYFTSGGTAGNAGNAGNTAITTAASASGNVWIGFYVASADVNETTYVVKNWKVTINGIEETLDLSKYIETGTTPTVEP